MSCRVEWAPKSKAIWRKCLWTVLMGKTQLSGSHFDAACVEDGLQDLAVLFGQRAKSMDDGYSFKRHF